MYFMIEGYNQVFNSLNQAISFLERLEISEFPEIYHFEA